MGSQTEVNNNQVLGVDDYKSSQEMLRTSLVVNIEKMGFEEEQGGEDLEAVNLAMAGVQEKEGKVDKVGTVLSMEEVDMNKIDLVEDVKTEMNLYEKGQGNDFGGTDEVESVLFEETKTEGNFIEKRRAVMSEVTDESVLNKKLDVADDLSTDDTVSVLELDVTAMKNFEEKEDEVSRLLFALRVLCTSDNTDVVLLCGAWQMRAHSQVKYMTPSRLLMIHCYRYCGPGLTHLASCLEAPSTCPLSPSPSCASTWTLALLALLSTTCISMR